MILFGDLFLQPKRRSYSVRQEEWRQFDIFGIVLLFSVNFSSYQRIHTFSQFVYPYRRISRYENLLHFGSAVTFS